MRQVFFSFHYSNDVIRAARVRNMYNFDDKAAISDNGWEEVRFKDNNSIKQWIDKEMAMRSCVVVLIGEKTATRPWVRYEIEQAWKKGKGVVGIYIHNLADFNGNQSPKGKNPFDSFYVSTISNSIYQRDHSINYREEKLSTVCTAYEPKHTLSGYVYEEIRSVLPQLVEDAIRIRKSYP